MRRLTALEPTGAPAASREQLEEIVARHGSAGEMIRTMAHSPALLQGYLSFSRAVKRTKLPRALSEKISLAVQEWLGCETCLNAHAEAARTAGLTDTDIALARQATATDPREAALLTFALKVLAEPAAISDDEISDLAAHGWTERTIADVVALVVLNQLTGTFNLVAGI
ncbi:alkylhydroperoxidase AhpD family core domain-containing protein [Saccharopolyspora antimicrobica]|uniref:AhpD family alkylhydroperoxidase n=1 Tax=Saccharopolyspora antimicrobica TaxID=455193 RepID=A0A1I5CGL3_9PSEU|nr:carboxymuconolactone decarboxylase family protein [Saccharopolyspora antimicrobica]RKT88860.1 AhpD family alkylhydroperoxidase [Saccharopolyspora antimicrobica]SFN86159.1 alkylhydroperoxidase AhpD family core domain-containing protein [Saccharopolyspora antimicrobica]